MELKVVYRVNGKRRTWVGSTLAKFMDVMEAKEVAYDLVDAIPVTDTEAEALRWQ
ncbi:hypothetical protein BcepSauron_142 [Burkholderia phage BcepSauron]|uniref:Uncharacterized protein n=2 Tax=Sarumanvirus TaxID=2843450 RepID=A0A482MMN5_9CAUD|nr:hypothetical protein H1O16_gp142 [Burkholderia phage BcepSaruman]YP_009904520.1 hypothetical protein H1O17_gp142 [Burkholderia phage BcepSauron]QBQ74522.1 hypothetical protein BcepSauron_142 [Burkholderia phage BcepSauron]QBX06555.1 hypothetical protein BcepSaruman_142 [Burkholderia phage BcepSaruman]